MPTSDRAAVSLQSSSCERDSHKAEDRGEYMGGMQAGQEATGAAKLQKRLEGTRRAAETIARLVAPVGTTIIKAVHGLRRSAGWRGTDEQRVGWQRRDGSRSPMDALAGAGTLVGAALPELDAVPASARGGVGTGACARRRGRQRLG
jgi:hypothetical protein